ncbi:MAG: hypothetical protein SGJ00_11995 [bacterium]|nr:hypothetical protein [bacterium]
MQITANDNFQLVNPPKEKRLADLVQPVYYLALVFSNTAFKGLLNCGENSLFFAYLFNSRTTDLHLQKLVQPKEIL